MARTLTEIYTEAQEARKKYLCLTEFENDSKMSIINALLWVSAACIWTFETILDVYTVDMVEALRDRINGTPAYYASALLKYQHGDTLSINEDGTSFFYSNPDKEKQIINKVSYSEFSTAGFHDKGLILKVSKEIQPGQYQKLSEDELIGVSAYIEQIKFAGTDIKVVSREGDVLCPKLTVYYDGAVPAEEVYENIAAALHNFLQSMQYDSVMYAQKVIDAIQKAEHVTDVYVDSASGQGIFIAQYNDDNRLIEVAPSKTDPEKYLLPIKRYVTSSSGYFKESTKTGLESQIATWKESIILKIEGEE